nr:epoxide hydrolase N-terminal domain-containing protein [Streptomyces lienomycini]
MPHHTAAIGGTPVHCLRFDGEQPGVLPIVLTHGSPSTFLELTDLARRLAEPPQHGGDASDVFTVVAPSLPGYAFRRSARPSRGRCEGARPGRRG